MDITHEMRVHYYRRTLEHICRVQKYMVSISERFPDLNNLMLLAPYHDELKFLNPECDPYIKLSWRAVRNLKGLVTKFSDSEENDIKKAIFHHQKHNFHHPERHDDNFTFDRMRTDYIVDATSMDTIYIAEMVADWAAMAEEFKDSLKGWADKHVNSRWRFTTEQTALIYELIEFCESVSPEFLGHME